MTPLRQYADSIANEDIHLYSPSGSVSRALGRRREAPAARLLFNGSNPPNGAVVYYYVKKAPKDEVKIDILDASGSVIRTYSSKRKEPLDEPLDPDDKKPEKQIKVEDGLNRFVWDLHYEDAHRVPGYYLWEYGDGARGPLAVPGKYQVRLTANGKSQTESFELKIDPRVTISQADLEKQFKLEMDLREQLNRVYDAVNEIQDVREQLDGLRRRVGSGCGKAIVGRREHARRPAGFGSRPTHQFQDQRQRRFTGLRAGHRWQTGISLDGSFGGGRCRADGGRV